MLLASLVVFTFLGSSSSTRFKTTFDQYEVNTICSETTDSKLCVKILLSNPLTEESDIPGLGKFLINYVQHNISDAVNQIQSIVKNITDPISKKLYNECVEYLKWSSTYCDNALKDLAVKDKTHFIDSLLEANKSGDDCRSHLQGRAYVAELMQKLDAFQNVCEIAVAVGNRLP